MSVAGNSVQIEYQDGTLILKGDWTLKNIAILRGLFREIYDNSQQVRKLDASQIDYLDSAGALLLQRLLSFFDKGDEVDNVELVGLSTRYLRLVQFIKKQSRSIESFSQPFFMFNWFHLVGQWFYNCIVNFFSFFGFIGQVMYSFVYLLRNFYLFDFSLIVDIVYDVLCRSLLLVAVTSFLIGLVLTFQMATELKIFGVELFAIQGTGVAILREFAALLTAIVISSRCATGFASMIGVMKVNLEIDALETMGRDALCTLVVPRVIAMTIALPLLTVWSNALFIFGSMIMSYSYLHVSFPEFLRIYSTSVNLSHFVLGMQKVPFFAFFIVVVGCYQGFKTPMTAEGIGSHTTKAAVHSLFYILVIDALCSILSRRILGY